MAVDPLLEGNEVQRSSRTLETASGPGRQQAPYLYKPSGQDRIQGVFVQILLACPLLLVQLLLQTIRIAFFLLRFFLPKPIAVASFEWDAPELQDPPLLPTSLAGKTIGFSGCANLWFYHLGAAACLQAADKKTLLYKSQSVLSTMFFVGVSSGSATAALMAAGVDLTQAQATDILIQRVLDHLEASQFVGLWPSSPSMRFCTSALPQIVEEMLSELSPDACKKASGRCGLATTIFTPCKRSFMLWPSGTPKALSKAMRASSAGPGLYSVLPFELIEYGIAIDGSAPLGASDSIFNLYPCDLRISPYNQGRERSDVGPADAQPDKGDWDHQIGLMTPVDAHKLFRAGHNAMCQWLHSHQ